MKNVVPALLVLLILIYSCKTTKKTSTYQAPVVVAEAPVAKPEPVKEEANPEPVKAEKPILERTEYDARVFIGKMRGIYPEHSDIWLLRRK